MADPYEGWAIVELMGHRRLAGYVTEAEQYGTAMLRLDVHGLDDTATPGVTQFYGGSAVYCITPPAAAATTPATRTTTTMSTPSSGGTVTVLAAQTSHQYKATHWEITPAGQLDILTVSDGEELLVATFAPGSWSAVHQDSARAT